MSLATDVGGGTSLSMLRTLADAYKVQALQHVRLPAWKALYTATRGARALGLDARDRFAGHRLPGRRGAVGLGARRGGAWRATTRHAPCTNACSRG
ncbi:MAG: hypothetical protein MZW92_56555 [Comamonadaceae bacterium]|nr:hypothetical protein [Comamonadaceae bacterium]